ncbi:MAG TPA: RIP metalloprotease RseP [Methylomirabilota bacterium]|nr:RIP metalloprotease RseP [Methylomirabilota bacterium]
MFDRLPQVFSRGGPLEMVVSFVVVIGVLILIHELGHFFVARLSGVGVERFSIGFGPVLARWRGTETEYCLSLIPMGGYVKMMGEENPLEGGETLPYEARKAFALKPLWVRFLIVFAGPGMNFVLAAVIFAIVLATVGRPVWPAVVGKVAPSSPAATAGLRTADTIAAVDGRRVAYWEDLERAITDSNGRPLALTVKRDAGEQTLTVTPRRKGVTDPIFRESRDVWDIGAGPQLAPQISSVGQDSPAQRAGLRPGDVVVSVAGQPVYTPEDLVEAIRTRPNQPFPVAVERDGKQFTVTITPDAVREKGPNGQEIVVGKIQAGIATKAVRFEPYDPITSVGLGTVRTWDMTVLTVKGLWKLVSRQIDSSNIGGPLQIATEAGRQAKEGFGSLLLFTAVISVNLAVLNLLPVPMLDGGHLFFFVIEAVLGRPLSLKKREAAQQLGFVLLMLLMVYALWNDLNRLGAFKFFGG